MNIAARRITGERTHGAKATGARDITIQTVARQMLDEASGDINAATIKLVNYVSNLPRLHDDLLQFGARQLLHSLPSTQRAAMMTERSTVSVSGKAPHTMSPGAKAAQARMRAAGATLKSALFNFEIAINNQVRKLADWTGTEILAHAEGNLAAGASAVRNARFLVSVARAAGDKRIGDAIDDETIERLKREAESSEV